MPPKYSKLTEFQQISPYMNPYAPQAKFFKNGACASVGKPQWGKRIKPKYIEVD